MEIDQVPGWDAIEGALRQLYPGQQPLHCGTVVKYLEGGPDPLDGISIYDHGDHWHYASYGFSELYLKESENPEVSGWGFELTFRLRKHDLAEPPIWVLDMMQNLARYVFDRGNVFKPGDHMDLNGPLSLEEPDTLITAAAFMSDPELPEWLETPHGSLRMVQLVGITADELAACRSWNTLGLLGLVNQRHPLGVTDLKRASVLDDPEAAEALEEGKEEDGSNTGMLFVEQASYRVEGEEVYLTLGAIAVDEIRDLLVGCLTFGKEFVLSSPGPLIMFRPGERAAWVAEPGVMELILDPISALGLAEVLQPKQGHYTVPEIPGLNVEIIPTAIRDSAGNIIQRLGE